MKKENANNNSKVFRRRRKTLTRAVLVAKQRVGLPSEPLIQWASPLGLISEKRSCDFVHFLFNNCSENPYRSRDICTGKFQGPTCNSLMGPHRSKMKGSYYSEPYSEQLLFYNALKNICRFRDMTAQKFMLLDP